MVVESKDLKKLYLIMINYLKRTFKRLRTQINSSQIYNLISIYYIFLKYYIDIKLKYIYNISIKINKGKYRIFRLKK